MQGQLPSGSPRASSRWKSPARPILLKLFVRRGHYACLRPLACSKAILFSNWPHSLCYTVLGKSFIHSCGHTRLWKCSIHGGGSMQFTLHSWKRAHPSRSLCTQLQNPQDRRSSEVPCPRHRQPQPCPKRLADAAAQTAGGEPSRAGLRRPARGAVLAAAGRRCASQVWGAWVRDGHRPSPHQVWLL